MSINPIETLCNAAAKPRDRQPSRLERTLSGQHLVDDSFLYRVAGFGNLIVDNRAVWTVAERNYMFHSVFDRHDRKPALDWLGEVLPDHDLLGLTA